MGMECMGVSTTVNSESQLSIPFLIRAILAETARLESGGKWVLGGSRDDCERDRWGEREREWDPGPEMECSLGERERVGRIVGRRMSSRDLSKARPVENRPFRDVLRLKSAGGGLLERLE